MLLNYTTFSRIEFEGIQFDNEHFKEKNNGRHVFRCSNEKFDVAFSDNVLEHISILDYSSHFQSTFIFSSQTKITFRKKDLLIYL